jgi:hypothetical protein
MSIESIKVISAIAIKLMTPEGIDSQIFLLFFIELNNLIQNC